MVKMPVAVYNYHDKTKVIKSALHLQRQLQLQAEPEGREGGRYIRHIVLIQAQPRTKDENIDFRKLKAKLLQLGIPEEEIKTAEIDELKGQDLMWRECKVKYIITANALKEGRDCPFAYIVASLADRSSAADVEQILGQVLRQPHVVKHQNYQLKFPYVLTASAKFHDTLQNIVKGLQNAGFSQNDCRSAEVPPVVEAPKQPAQPYKIELLNTVSSEEPPVDTEDDIALARIQFNPQAAPAEAAGPATVNHIARRCRKPMTNLKRKPPG